MARIWSSSNRRLPIIGRERRSSAMPTLSSCRGSRTCDGAATRWCWNRRAPARCSKYAIRRSRPSWPCFPRRNKSNSCVGRTVFRGHVSRFAAGLPNRFQGRRHWRQRPAAGGGRPQPRSLGLSRSSVPHAQHRRPTCQPAWRSLSLCRRHFCRCRRCGPTGPERKSICTSSRRRIRRQSRRSRSSCGNVIRRAALMTSGRSRSPSFRNFSTAPRASCRDRKAGLDLDDGGHAVRPYPSAGASYELELYLAVDKCEGLARGFYHYDAGAHALVPIGVPRVSSKRCWRDPNMPWVRPPRPRS